MLRRPAARPPVADSTANANPPPAAPTGPALDVSVSGPDRAVVGEKAVFQITLSNRTAAPLRDLRIRVQLDPGLEHGPANEHGAFERTLPFLAGGESTTRQLTAAVTRSGRLYLSVEVTGPATVPAGARAGVNAVVEERKPLGPDPAAVAPPAGAGQQQEQPAPIANPAPAVLLNKSGPTVRRVGQRAVYDRSEESRHERCPGRPGSRSLRPGPVPRFGDRRFPARGRCDHLDDRRAAGKADAAERPLRLSNRRAADVQPDTGHSSGRHPDRRPELAGNTAGSPPAAAARAAPRVAGLFGGR